MSNSNFLSSRGRCIFFFACLLLAVFITGRSIAADKKQQKPPEVTAAKRKSSGPHCGLYCLYTVAKMTGQQIEFQELIKPEYLGSPLGSSLAELKKAAEDNGLYAVPAGKLTSRELHNCPHPVILHVKSDATSKRYDHYELFLGTKEGQARLFNPPEPVKLVAFAELVPRWDGNGLIVSAEPIDLGSIFAPARKRFMIYVVSIIAAILMVHWGKRWLPAALFDSRRKLLGLSMAQGAGFAIAALLCGMIYHFANDAGFLAHPKATSSIQQAHIGNFIPKVTEKKVNQLLNNDTIFIDARFARDFKAGHLEGAINLPVDANDVDYQKAMADIAKDARIVVYCQSAGCQFAEKVAIKLMEGGFSNVSIFKGGLHEWAAKSDS